MTARITTIGAGLAGSLAIGLTVGAITGAAGRSLYVVGLYEVAAALFTSFLVVAWLHYLRLRTPALLAAVAIIVATSWLVMHVSTDAWLFRIDQVTNVAENELLLTEHAIAHDSANADTLVDASLLSETGAAGVQGAARLLLGRGLVVHRVGDQHRILAVPRWLHALARALLAAMVALWCHRALQTMSNEPVCQKCDQWLRRRPLGYIDEASAKMVTALWASGDRNAPSDTIETSNAMHRHLVLEDRCPLGHSKTPGYALLRQRSHRWGRQRPGPIARIEPQT